METLLAHATRVGTTRALEKVAGALKILYGQLAPADVVPREHLAQVVGHGSERTNASVDLAGRVVAGILKNTKCTEGVWI